MAYEVQKAHWHALFGYNSPHLPLGTSPEEETLYDESTGLVVGTVGDAHEFSETLDPEHSDAPKRRTRKKSATPVNSHDPSQEDLENTPGPSSLVTPDPLIEEIETSQNEYKEDLVDPEQLESVETSQNEYRDDTPEDYVEAHDSENSPQETENT